MRSISHRGLARAILQVSRPKQWIKNILVAAAPIASGQIIENLIEVSIGILGFILMSIFGYLINDWSDRNFDRFHVVKRNRSFASGKLVLKHLLVLMFFSFSGAIYCGYLLSFDYALVLISYMVISVSYSLVLKHIPVIEFMWLASSFLVRAIAGSVIISESPSGWFLVCIYFGALMVVLAKRIAEVNSPEGTSTRKVIHQYTLSFLQSVFTACLTTTSLTYALWAIDLSSNDFFAKLSILPFITSLYLYSFLCEKNDAQEPETLLFKSPIFLSTSVITILNLLVVFYL